MNIPNLPTDNLYKFIALSGVVIFLFFNIYPDIILEKIEEEITTAETEILELKHKSKMLDLKQKELKIEIEQAKIERSKYQYNDSLESIINIEELSKKLQNQSNREYLEFIFKYEKDIFPFIRIYEEIQSKNEKIKNVTLEELLLLHRIERKLNIISKKNASLSKSLLKWSIGNFIGMIMMLYGFRLWYTRVQKPLDKKLLKEII